MYQRHFINQSDRRVRVQVTRCVRSLVGYVTCSEIRQGKSTGLQARLTLTEVERVTGFSESIFLLAFARPQSML